MYITFLGVGDAFSIEQRHTSALINFNDFSTNLCIDFPATNRYSLRDIGKDLGNIKNIFITHLHEDHVNGIQQLAYFNEITKSAKPSLFIPEKLENGLRDILKEGLYKTSYGEKKLEDYFDVNIVKDHFILNNKKFKIIQTNHVPNMFSYGLLGENFYYSGDSNIDVDFINSIKDKVDYIFHDCHLWDLEIKSHASLEDIKKLDSDIMNKIYLMHYHDGYSDESIKRNFEKRENIKLVRQLKIYRL
jgi:Metal-dependent hydrolases of the beta-lactamase superfamily III